MLKAIHWTEHGFPNEGARQCIQGAEGICRPIGEEDSLTTHTRPHNLVAFLGVYLSPIHF
ncbi:hypothetical protein T03_3287 [Trichinella britovi]|uniref:Uncharacterized protein n=1 Tax=Trichinella britovi TaxID=45882 RepID=A0A0V1AH41_TRIBR|nr:hypothetical protein T03_3287 [Trichinella britovi]